MKEILKKITSVIMFLLFIFLFFKVINVFIVSICWALIFALIFNPLNSYISKKLKSETRGILITTIIFILIILIPITFFITKLSIEVYSFTPDLLKKISANSDEMEKYYKKAKNILDEFGISLKDVTNFFAGKISLIIQKLFQNLLKFFFHLFFIIVFFYSFLKYKIFFIDILKSLLPFGEEKNIKFFEEIANFVQAIFYGIFLTAIFQAILAMVGFYFSKIPAPLFFGTLTFIFAFVPIGGSSIVWAPLSIYLILIGDIKYGIFLFFWCLIFVSTLDNLIRPYLVSRKFKVNPLFIFISILGGISSFGGLGIFYGPIVIFSIYKTIENFREIKI